MTWKSLSRLGSRLLRPMRTLPLHPQWHVERYTRRTARYLREETAGTVLDIGCGRMEIRRALTPERHRYIGIDYPPTAVEWYGARPHIYADGAQLPVRSATADVVLALNVLEHLRDPAACLAEIQRALKDDGVCVIEVPFLYPIHDAPRDFTRWTRYGLETLLQNHGLELKSVAPLGRPPETSALLINLALAERMVRFWAKKNPLIALLPLTLPIFLLLNVVSFLLAAVWASDFMPYGYRLIVRKRSAAA